MTNNQEIHCEHIWTLRFYDAKIGCNDHAWMRTCSVVDKFGLTSTIAFCRTKPVPKNLEAHRKKRCSKSLALHYYSLVSNFFFTSERLSLTGWTPQSLYLVNSKHQLFRISFTHPLTVCPSLLYADWSFLRPKLVQTPVWFIWAKIKMTF